MEHRLYFLGFCRIANQRVASTDDNVVIGDRATTHGVYQQTIYLDDTFELILGASEPVLVSVERAAVNSSEDALDRLIALSDTLNESSSNYEIALQLIDPVQYESRKMDRDILAKYDANKSIELEYADSVLDLEFSMAKAVSGDFDLAFDIDDLPTLGPLLSNDDLG